MAFGGRVHLLLQQPLVRRRDRVLRPAEDLRTGSRRVAERVLGDRVADPPLDPLGPERDLVLAGAPRAIPPRRTRRRRPCGHRDRRVHAAERDDAGNAPAGADDDLAADLLPQDPVGRADVTAALRRHGRGLQPEPLLADRRGRLVDRGVAALPPRLEREVEPRECEFEPGHVGREDAKRLLEQLLPGLGPPRGRQSCARPSRRRFCRLRVRGGGYIGVHAEDGGWRRGGAGAPSGTRTRGGADHRRREARADRGARHPAGLARRLDLPAREREAASCGRRRRRSAPVPVPPGVPRQAGAGEVRRARPLRRAAPRAARGDVRAQEHDRSIAST